jgi:hypothetical protein
VPFGHPTVNNAHGDDDSVVGVEAVSVVAHTGGKTMPVDIASNCFAI